MKILFVSQQSISRYSFIERDRQILQSAHTVKDFPFAGVKSLPSLWREVWWSDMTFSWFGKLHAFFAVLFSKLLGKKAIAVAGGDDVAYEPEIEYGMFVCWWKKWCPLFVFNHAHLILSVSDFNRRETLKNAKADPMRTKLLYHGFDPDRWQPEEGIEKEDLILTVGGVTNENLQRKGLELFVRSARYLPNVPFVLVGPWQDSAIGRLKAIAPSNVTFAGGVYGEDLLRIFSRAKAYVQISRYESFGCAVAEAMLCECVPVVSRRAALPEVVGDCGFYVDDLAPEVVALRIKEALESPNESGKKARERIRTFFPFEKRKRELLEAIASLKY